LKSPWKKTRGKQGIRDPQVGNHCSTTLFMGADISVSVRLLG